MKTTAATALLFVLCGATIADNPLPSWNDGSTRSAIIDFVEQVTREGGSSYVPPAERIAVFDNDGTLRAFIWCIFKVESTGTLMQNPANISNSGA